MSIIKIQTTTDAVAAVTYASHGTAEAAQNGVVREGAMVTTASLYGDMSPVQTAIRMAQDVKQYGRGKRKNQATVIIQSFHPDELKIDDPSDVERAHWAGARFAQELAPDSDFVVATHVDGDGGHVHNHIIISNHSITSKRATEQARNVRRARHVNDDVMREMGLRVEQLAPKSVTGPERWAQKRGAQTQPDSYDEAPTVDTWKAHVRMRLDRLLDENAETFGRISDDDRAMGLLEKLAPSYGLDVRVNEKTVRKTGGVKRSISYGLHDLETGVLLHFDRKKPTKSGLTEFAATVTGPKLGGDYSIEGLTGRFTRMRDAERERQHREHTTDTTPTVSVTPMPEIRTPRVETFEDVLDLLPEMDFGDWVRALQTDYARFLVDVGDRNPETPAGYTDTFEAFRAARDAEQREKMRREKVRRSRDAAVREQTQQTQKQEQEIPAYLRGFGTQQKNPPSSPQRGFRDYDFGF